MATQKITARQIGKIKQLQKMRGINDADYRDALAEWGVTSCTELSFGQAKNLIAMWINLARAEGVQQPPKKPQALKYSDLDGRGREWPSGKQLRLLFFDGFVKVSRAAKTELDDAYDTFLYNRFSIAGVSQILKKDVQRIKRTFDEMKRQQHEKASKTYSHAAAQRAAGAV